MGSERSGKGAGSVLARAAVAVLALAAAAAIVWVLWINRPQAPRVAETPPPPTVEVVRLEPVPVVRAWEGYGTARAMDRAEVSAEIGGRIVERPDHIEAGATVAAGEVLLRIDPTDYLSRERAAEQALAQWQADLAAWDIEKARLGEQVELREAETALDQREYERASRALELGGGNESEVEARLAALRRSQRELAAQRQALDLMGPRRERLLAVIGQAEATLALAREDLRRTVLTSPIAGSLQSVRGEVGELMAPGSPVATVVDLSRLEVPLRVPVSGARALSVGDGVTLRTDTRGGTAHRATIARIAPESDPQTRTVTVFVELRQAQLGAAGQAPGTAQDGEPLLRPGQFVVASVSSAQAEPAIVVPRRAVDDERVLVVSLEDGTERVRARDVRVAYHIDAAFPALAPAETQWAVIESGLGPGERVVVSNLNALVPGMAVRAVLPPAAAAAGDAPVEQERGAGG